uniref:Uncharacterized protein n=1 Tax=Oryza barthii TaxID=65489 RepID=A0A0D3F0E3_9ORYZ
METYSVLGQAWAFTKLKEQTKYLFDSLIVLGCFALNNWSVEGVKKDYGDTAVLFRKLLSESMGEETVHPPDFGMLLSLMEKDGFRNKYLIGTHVSLLPDDNISIVYMKIHEFIRKILPAEEKDKARQLKLGITSHSRISTRIRRQTVHPPDFGMLLSLMEKDGFRNKLDLLKLGFRYKANEVDRMWHAEFPTLLAELQLALFLVDRLEELELEKNFMNRKPMRPKVSSHGTFY